MNFEIQDKSNASTAVKDTPFADLRLPTILEETILIVLSTGSSHGWNIVKKVNAAIAKFNSDVKANKKYSFGSIYPTLRRMESKLGWLESKIEKTQGNEAKIVPRKKNYRLTDKGLFALEMAQKYRESIEHFRAKYKDLKLAY